MIARGLPAATPHLRWGTFLAVATIAGAALVAGLALKVAGPAIALLPATALVALLVVAYPRAAALTLFAAGIGIDTAGIDLTEPIARNLWEMPAPIAGILPLKTNPFELLLALNLGAVILRRPPTPPNAKLPGLAYLAPLALLAGLLYGLSRGGPVNLAYHEMRGLLFATVAFVIVWRLRLTQRELAIAFFAGSTWLGLVSLSRYVFYLASDRSGIPKEFWFGHETGLFLAIGFVVGSVALLRAENDRQRLYLVLYAGLMATSMLMTGRRSAILVVLTGMLLVGWLLLPRRPVLLVTLSVVGLVAGAFYLSAYWDSHSGPLAQPARAIRSQIDPDSRDKSSDEYRQLERENLERTIAADPVLGVGFGRPFTQFEPLPELDFWPMQSYTPHQNILWLWLKTGIAGASVLIGLWVVAMSRCIRACASFPRSRDIPIAPMVIAATLLMYITFARVDHALVNSRSAVPFALALALALLLPINTKEGARNG